MVASQVRLGPKSEYAVPNNRRGESIQLRKLTLGKRARNDEEKKEEETAASTMVDTTRFEKHFSFVSPMGFFPSMANMVCGGNLQFSPYVCINSIIESPEKRFMKYIYIYIMK